MPCSDNESYISINPASVFLNSQCTDSNDPINIIPPVPTVIPAACSDDSDCDPIQGFACYLETQSCLKACSVDADCPIEIICPVETSLSSWGGDNISWNLILHVEQKISS